MVCAAVPLKLNAQLTSGTIEPPPKRGVPAAESDMVSGAAKAMVSVFALRSMLKRLNVPDPSHDDAVATMIDVPFAFKVPLFVRLRELLFPTEKVLADPSP